MLLDRQITNKTQQRQDDEAVFDSQATKLCPSCVHAEAHEWYSSDGTDVPTYHLTDP